MCRYSAAHEGGVLKDMIFILNSNPTSLSFYESWSYQAFFYCLFTYFLLSNRGGGGTKIELPLLVLYLLSNILFYNFPLVEQRLSILYMTTGSHESCGSRSFWDYRLQSWSSPARLCSCHNFSLGRGDFFFSAFMGCSMLQIQYI